MDSRMQDILDRFDNVKPYGQNRWLACCPAHGDKQQSLCITLDSDRILINCFAGCDTSEVLASTGLVFDDLFLGDKKSKRTPIKKRPKPKKKKPEIRREFIASGEKWIIYSYYNVAGKLVHQTCRIPGETTEYKVSTGEFIRKYTDKEFRQRRPDPDKPGQWIWSLVGIESVLYNLPAINKADTDTPIFLVEGEKDADNLSLAFKVISTTQPLGGGKWQPQWTDMLAGRKVYIIPDNDKTGTKTVKIVAPELCNAGCQVKVIWLPEAFNDKPINDVSDWLNAGGTRKQLKELIEAQSFFASPLAERRGENGQSKTTCEAIYSQPLRLAEYILRKNFMAEGHNTLYRWRDGWYDFTGTHYEEIESMVLRGKIYRRLDRKVDTYGEAIVPDQTLVNKVVDAIPGALPSLIINKDIKPPMYLSVSDADSDPNYLVSCQNGVLNLLTRELLPHSPRLFTVNALPFDYDPKAKCPEWDKFIDSIWEGDAESAITLRQWMGYCLTNDTSMQKILLIQGDKRSGKGTIAKVITALLGERNVANPTMTDLGHRFGLEPLLEKLLAVIPDARMSNRTDSAAIVERLLSISGEDKLVIERKNRPALPGVKLDTRIVILTNILPRLTDESGALASRFLPLSMPRSFLGQEDTHLIDKLLAELPGILNYALVGLDILNETKSFHIPTASQEIIDDFRKFTSPIKAFVEECCKLDAVLNTDKDRLYDAWCSYRKSQGINKHPSKAVFVRDLKSAYPFIKPSRKRVEGERTHFLEGIGLKEGVQLDLSFIS